MADKAEVIGASCDYGLAYLKCPSSDLKPYIRRLGGQLFPNSEKALFGNEELPGNGIAIALSFIVCSGGGVRNPGVADPNMGQLMRKGEYPCGGCVGTIDENNWANWIRDRKATKFRYRQRATGIISNDAVFEYE